jgi:hypothetical protein
MVLSGLDFKPMDVIVVLLTVNALAIMGISAKKRSVKYLVPIIPKIMAV